ASGLQRRILELEDAARQMREVLAEREAGLQQSLLLHCEETSKLVVALEEQSTQVRELTLRVSLADGRVQGLEEQLGHGEAQRRELEHRLVGLTSALRRTLGIGRNGRSQTPGSRGRSLSPWRSRSPVKGETSTSPRGPVSFPSCSDEGELDVDAVQNALRDFHQELKDTKRHRDEAKAQVTSLTRQVAELQTSQDKSGTRLQQLTKALKGLEEGKREVLEQLYGAQTSLSLQEEVTRRGDRDRKSLAEEGVKLKTSLQTAEANSRTLQEKLDRSLAGEARCEGERRRLKEALETAESRASRLELAQRTLEGELQRAQRRTAELEGEVAALGERSLFSCIYHRVFILLLRNFDRF
ncbi:rootletin, partial [Salvelinus sp. IW2-2015]|uniref:rootletin n=1 Tax=Salvelinus sp. IW2-2015 TaxID=2691554 RepID=UPI0038D3DC31